MVSGVISIVLFCVLVQRVPVSMVSEFVPDVVSTYTEA